jgi:hypothetical protein
VQENYKIKTPVHNSTYKKLAVQWLNQALCGEALLAIKSKPLGFYQSSCLVDSELLRNRQLLLAAKH